MDEGQPHAETEAASQAGGQRTCLARPAPVLPPGAMTTVAVLLTAGSAATDVASFSRLGGVFASVMTSNIVFLGLAAARTSATLAVHAAVSFLGYVLGVAAGSRLTGAGRGRGRRDGHGTAHWPARITVALLIEIGLFIAFTAGWVLTGARPAGEAQLVILGVATAAMGVQSATVLGIGLAGVSTTYMTGTLTTLVTAMATPDSRERAGRHRLMALFALAAGAGLGGVLLAYDAATVPVIPLAALLGVLVTGTGKLQPPRRRLFSHTIFYPFYPQVDLISRMHRMVPVPRRAAPDNVH
ncbi:MAG TPA: YoaK family protein [Streptosporangiaceae bacterium]|nr:YoaK family protein [Streptosporangiaceae bacterium]